MYVLLLSCFLLSSLIRSFVSSETIILSDLSSFTLSCPVFSCFLSSLAFSCLLYRSFSCLALSYFISSYLLFSCSLGALGHYFRQGAIIKETKETYIEKKVIAVSGVGDSACIRYVSVLPPIGSRASVDPVRQLKSSIDNTLYIYPLVFEKFSHRNLCIKIQLVEFISSVPGRLPDPTQPYHILRNIYSTMPGAPFSTSAFTTVSYHSKLPILNEEIKVRLPDVLTDRHWLIFTVHHVHVKQKTATNKSFLGIVSFTPGELLDTSSTIVGAGFLPLMADGEGKKLYLTFLNFNFSFFLFFLFMFFLFSSSQYLFISTFYFHFYYDIFSN